ncbi:MAG: XdhC family protein [Acidimicrobiaceae bacterium]|nr:XdhC family protein [Acidimicrobiaceae bacterium]
MNRVDFPNSDFILARAVTIRGIGGRRAGELLVIDADGSFKGSLFGGVADSEIRQKAEEISHSAKQFDLITIMIGDKDAVMAGLACGGEADVLLNRRSGLPGGFTEKVSHREPVALATVISGPHGGLVLSLSSGEDAAVTGMTVVVDEFLDKLKLRLQEALLKRFPASMIEEFEGELVAFEVFSPATHMLIVGKSDLSDALIAQGQLLGWSGSVVDGAEDGVEQVRSIGSNDALIVLSHDHQIGIPIVTEVLKGSKLTYIGGLGSRHTQQTRSELLSEEGFSGQEIARIYGPVGLDLGSKTPEETALAICAEIMAHISGRQAGSLKYSSGPING